jgi:MFS family permease
LTVRPLRSQRRAGRTVEIVTSAATAPLARGGSLLSKPVRATTVGMVLVITVVAFEALAVATALPTAVRELDGLAYYSWPFTAFLVSSVIAMVLAGELCDRRGPRRALLSGLAVFAVGLLVAGFAQQMAVFVLGRAVAGFGAGAISVGTYVMVAEVYEERLRPKVFAVISAAWVLPSLIGPLVSGVLTQALSWRLVFAGMAPFPLIGLVLVLPAVRRLRPRDEPVARGRRAPYAVLAALGLAALQYAGQRPRWVVLPLALAGLAALVPALRRLLPRGTLTLRRGLPAAVGYRALLAGAFFGADAFVPLTLSTVHGYSPALAGLPLTIAALGWSAGSWYQSRPSAPARHTLIRLGCAFVGSATGLLVLVAWPGPPGWLATPVWTLAGFGMGLGIASVGLLTLERSAPEERGANGAALQICDVLASATLIGLAGVVLATVARGGGSASVALTIVDLTMAAVAAVGVALAGRLRD